MSGVPLAEQGKYRQAGTVVMVFLLAIALADNARVMVAELAVMPARNALNRHDDKQWRDRDAVYADATSAVQRGLSLYPENPEYLELKGRIGLDACRHWVDKNDAQRTCLQVAQQDLLAAITVAPRSASLWANLLLVKSRLGEFDQQFIEILHKTLELGSSLLEINQVVAFVGLREWTRWDSATRELFMESLLNVHRVSPKEAKAVADRAGRGALYCLVTKGDARQHYSCRQKKKKVEKKPAVTAVW